MARYYPDRAQRMSVEGRANLSCTVTSKGTLEGCSVVSEDPADYGFGDAAIKMSKLFKMKPKTLDGAPVEGGTVRIPLAFRLPKG
jgi:protein TonB